MILTRISYLIIAAVVAIAAAAAWSVWNTDDAASPTPGQLNPGISIPQMISNASSIDVVEQSGRRVIVRFKDDFDAQSALNSDSRTFEMTLPEDIGSVSDVFRFANVPVGEGGVRVTGE